MLALAAAAACATAAASTPPPALLVDVNRGTVGGLRLGEPSSAYVARLGLPDYSGAIESPTQQEMLWTLGASTMTAWSVLRLNGSTTAGEFLFAGRFLTAAGDRPGTKLAAFQQHWTPKRPVHTVVRHGVTVEYNVVVGSVVFAFDKAKTLQAVGLAPARSGAALCVIPYLCVASALG